MTANPNPDLSVGRGSEHVLDPRGIRINLTEASGRPGLGPVVLEAPGAPLAPLARTAGLGPLGGTAITGPSPDRAATAAQVVANGRPTTAELRRIDAERAVLVFGDETVERASVLMLPPTPSVGQFRGVMTQEVVIDGWRVLVEIEPAGRAALRERARRGVPRSVRADQPRSMPSSRGSW